MNSAHFCRKICFFGRKETVFLQVVCSMGLGIMNGNLFSAWRLGSCWQGRCISHDSKAFAASLAAQAHEFVQAQAASPPAWHRSLQELERKEEVEEAALEARAAAPKGAGKKKKIASSGGGSWMKSGMIVLASAASVLAELHAFGRCAQQMMRQPSWSLPMRTWPSSWLRR